MNRRSYLRTAGLATTLGVAGCLGGDGNDGTEAANEYGYSTVDRNGVEVPLVPIEDAYEWYQEDDDVLFVDARDATAYESAHVAGAVLSPAPDGQSSDDPVEGESTSTTLVTYCVCPHGLSTTRGATLIENGYVHTYAIDEGFEPWLENGYPVEGDDVASLPDSFAIRGRTDPSLAGDRAWLRHEPTGQREVTDIAPDGTFEMEVLFYEVGPGTEVRLSTPAAEVTDTLRSLSSDVVDV